jgi:hypothetical protein
MPRRMPDEVIERTVQVLGERVHAALPSGIHFLLIAYRAGDGHAFLTWTGSGTPEDRRNAIAELHTTFQA